MTFERLYSNLQAFTKSKRAVHGNTTHTSRRAGSRSPYELSKEKSRGAWRGEENGKF
eukprot:c6300_g1_i1 orf=62-232(-)